MKPQLLHLHCYLQIQSPQVPHPDSQGKVVSQDKMDSSGQATPEGRSCRLAQSKLHPPPDSFPPGPQDTESTPSSATWGQEGLSEQPLEGQTAEAHSLTPWDSTQVRQRFILPMAFEYLLSPGSSECQQQCSVMGAYHTFPTLAVNTHVPESLFIHSDCRRKGLHKCTGARQSLWMSRVSLFCDTV